MSLYGIRLAFQKVLFLPRWAGSDLPKGAMLRSKHARITVGGDLDFQGGEKLALYYNETRLASKLQELIPTQIQDLGGKLACICAQLGLGKRGHVEAQACQN